MLVAISEAGYDWLKNYAAFHPKACAPSVANTDVKLDSTLRTHIRNAVKIGIFAVFLAEWQIKYHQAC